MRTLLYLTIAFQCNGLFAAHPLSAPKVTSLTNSSVKYRRDTNHYARLQRGPVTAVIVTNKAIQDGPYSKHRAGYNGVAALVHKAQPASPFVPFYAGLNYEHIHDGTLKVDKERFEPRRVPMELRIINKHTVELYQAPTPNWDLESCGRYQLLPDGTIEYTFECIARKRSFQQNYIGLFWASYIDAPQDKGIYFRGAKPGQPVKWLRAYSERHGLRATHPPLKAPIPKVDPKFSLTLVNHPSPIRYSAPWYYGKRRGMALAYIFRQRDQIWFAKSPTGGGAKNPAWDFQWFIHNYRVNEAYGFVMRLAYVPFKSRKSLEEAVQPHLRALNPNTRR